MDNRFDLLAKAVAEGLTWREALRRLRASVRRSPRDYTFDFDELSKALAGGLSRREALRRVGVGLAGAFLAWLGVGKAWAVDCSSSGFCSGLGTMQTATCVSQCNTCQNAGNVPCSHNTGGQVQCCTTGMSICCGTSCATCPVGGSTCSMGNCVCPTGQTVCGAMGVDPGTCRNLQTDVNNCGMCGTVCPARANAVKTCTSGTCGFTCNAGFGDCDSNATNGCETALNTNTNCGACGVTCSRAHATASCSTGTCVLGTCDSGFGNCDSNDANGCETALNTNTNCGACGVTCSRAHATASCSTGTCVLGTCDSGFGNCDSNDANGCETALNTNTNCGACGVTCSRAHATASCSTGTCVLGTCDSGFGNCDSNDANGCETNLNTLTDCGACGVTCSRANATASCSTGTCVLVSCNAGFGNCDSNDANGCETNLNTSLNNCGTCGNVCSFPNASATCVSGTCTLGTCNAGFGNCDSNDANGCETNLNTSVNNCGTCGNVCSFPNASATCVSGTCTLGTCNAGFGNCDSNDANGCETNLNTSLNNCGACGNVCSFPNASATCVSGVCTLGTCNAGFGNCDSNDANGCETNLNTSLNNCGACGNVCSFPNASATCVSGTCTLGTCNAGFGNCDSNDANGCETNLNTSLNNCGACGNVCSFPNASATCVSGTCTLGTCNAGFGNCDSNDANGCETNLNTSVNNCGACGNVCSFPNASATCVSGTCTLGTCNSGFGNCDSNAANGCETNLNTNVNNCGTCGHVCPTGANCVSGSCVCPMGQTACGSNPGACVNLQSDANNCGSCGNTCGSGAFCSSGVCCPTGQTNCGGACVNTSTDVNNCGACSNSCPTPANATRTCTSGTCGFTCNSGFGNCDSNAANGCETNLNTNVNNCGTCGHVCSFPHASATCVSGTCTLGTCNAGFGNCDSNAANGCEANLNTDSLNCGACGRRCVAGQHCASGTCVCDSNGQPPCNGVCCPSGKVCRRVFGTDLCVNP